MYLLEHRHSIYGRLYVLFSLFTALACGREWDQPFPFSEEHQAAIINGTATNYTEFQGVIGLHSAVDDALCTGTLLNPSVVLTAGHCVFNPARGVDYVSDTTGLTLHGGNDLFNSGTVIDYGTVSQVVIHPTWEQNQNGSQAVDLALLLLDSPLDDLETYPVRTSPAPEYDETGMIVGYGLYSSSDPASGGIHRKGLSNILTVLPHLIEVGSPSSTCLGDSGGPLFTWKNERWVVSGVTSFGTSETCSATDDGWMINLVTYRDWIADEFFAMTGTNLSTDGTSLDTDSLDDSDTETAPASDTDEDSDSDTEVHEPFDPCGGECSTGAVTNCTCAVHDPCEWRDDGICQDDCLEFVDVTFNDVADCVGIREFESAPSAGDHGCSAAGRPLQPLGATWKLIALLLF